MTTKLLKVGKRSMVYCSKCGTLNPDDAKMCSKCGAILYTNYEDTYQRQKRYEDKERQQRYRISSGIGALILGIIIIIIGLRIIFPEVIGAIPWWPIILITIGIWLISIGVRKNRKYS